MKAAACRRILRRGFQMARKLVVAQVALDEAGLAMAGRRQRREQPFTVAVALNGQRLHARPATQPEGHADVGLAQMGFRPHRSSRCDRSPTMYMAALCAPGRIRQFAAPTTAHLSGGNTSFAMAGQWRRWQRRIAVGQRAHALGHEQIAQCRELMTLPR